MNSKRSHNYFFINSCKFVPFVATFVVFATNGTNEHEYVLSGKGVSEMVTEKRSFLQPLHCGY